MADKKYSLWMEEDEVVLFEVDGKKYKSTDEVPDPTDRARLERMEFAVFGIDREDFTGSTSWGVGKYILPIFLLVALASLITAVWTGINTARTIASEQSVPGRVVRMVIQRSSDNTTDLYYPVITYTLPDNSLQTIEMNEGSWPPAYEIGQEVTVKYLPDRPSAGRIAGLGSDIAQWTLTIIFGALGIAFSVATAFVYWLLKPSKPKRASAQNAAA